MKSILSLLILLTFSLSAQAQEEFQEELKLPQAHYSPVYKKIIVQVEVDEQNLDNFAEQERIINTIQDENPIPVLVEELAPVEN